ncbi:MAG: hypothetical protein PWP58_1661, partial [Bacillota bacterium]|nr:hypothetical protein [Bacillota bacterium]
VSTRDTCVPSAIISVLPAHFQRSYVFFRGWNLREFLLNSNP